MTKPLQVSPASRIPAKTVSKDSVQLVADCVRVRMTEMVVAANLNGVVGTGGRLNAYGALQAYDNVRPARLPALLRDENPGGRAWRLVDGEYTRADVHAPA